MKPVSSLMNPVEPSIGSRLRILGILSGCMILVESPNPLITKEAHQYKKADIYPASGVALHTTEVAWEHMPICVLFYSKKKE
jgi:hypothetical protein